MHRVLARRNPSPRALSKAVSREACEGNLDMMSRLLLVVAVCIAAASAIPAWGAEQPKLRVAVVDVLKLQEKYKALQDKEAQLEAERRRYAQILSELSRYTFLSAEMFKEIAAIARLPKPWPEDKQKRAQELLKISEEKEKEYLALRSNTKRSPQEEDRFKTLQELVQAREADLRQIQQSYVQRLLDLQRQLQSELLKKVRDTIAVVAKEKKYDLVLDSESVFFGGDDITDAVIEALNKAGASSPGGKEGKQG